MKSDTLKSATLMGVLILIALGIAVAGYVLGLNQGNAGLANGPFLVGAAGAAGKDSTGAQYTLNCGQIFNGSFSMGHGLGAEAEITPQKITSGPGQEKIKLSLDTIHIRELVLRRAITTDLAAYNWWKKIADGQLTEAIHCELSILDERMNPVAQFTLTNTWPVSYFAHQPLANSSDLKAYETLTLMYGNFVRVK
jgi:phage tail-like protein